MLLLAMPSVADTLVLKNGNLVSGTYEGGTAKSVIFRGPDGVVKDYDILSVKTVHFGDEANPVASATPQLPPRGGEPIYTVGGGVSAPQPTSTVLPEYSDDGRKARVQGIVELVIVVKADGTVDFKNVKKSLGYGLDQKAIDAVKKWKYLPGQKDGVPVATLITVSINFSLR
jgi:TonB family protein